MRTDTFIEQFFHQMQATPGGMVACVFSAIVIYLLFLMLVRLTSPRVLHGIGTFDALFILLFGGVCARVMLGNEPTLPNGIAVMLTLFVMEAIFGEIRRTFRGGKLVNHAPHRVIIDGEIQLPVIKRLRITEAEIASVLRRSGVRDYAEVQLLILEPNGQFSLIRQGEKISPELFTGIK